MTLQPMVFPTDLLLVSEVQRAYYVTHELLTPRAP